MYFIVKMQWLSEKTPRLSLGDSVLIEHTWRALILSHRPAWKGAVALLRFLWASGARRLPSKLDRGCE
jgi:hypothetical protein